MIFVGLKVVLFKRETFVSEFLFKLFDHEKVLHNCNRQNIHVAETTCTPASAIFFLKESDPPTLHCAPVVVVYERRGPQKLSFHDNASFKNSDRSKITN